MMMMNMRHFYLFTLLTSTIKCKFSSEIIRVHIKWNGALYCQVFDAIENSNELQINIFEIGLCNVGIPQIAHFLFSLIPPILMVFH